MSTVEYIGFSIHTLQGPLVALLVHTIRFLSTPSEYKQLLLSTMGTAASCSFSVEVSSTPVSPQPELDIDSSLAGLAHHRHALPDQQGFRQIQEDRQG